MIRINTVKAFRLLFTVYVICSCKLIFAQEECRNLGTKDFAKPNTLVVSNSYNTARTFKSYAQIFTPEILSPYFLNLNSNHRWLDGGGGEGLAAFEYLGTKYSSRHDDRPSFQEAGHLKSAYMEMYLSTKKFLEKITSIKPNDKAEVTVLTYHENDIVSSEYELTQKKGFQDYYTPPKKENWPHYKTGKLIEELTDAEINEMGKFDLITDVVGALSWSKNFSQVLNFYLKILQNDGTILFSGEKNNFLNTTVVDSKSNKLTLFEWLQSQPNIDVKITHTDRFMVDNGNYFCLLYTSPSPRDRQKSRMPSSA